MGVCNLDRQGAIKGQTLQPSSFHASEVPHLRLNCLLVHADSRPTALEALHHPWLEAAAFKHSISAPKHDGSSSSSSGEDVGGKAEELAERRASGNDSSSHAYDDDSLVQRLQQFGMYNRWVRFCLHLCCGCPGTHLRCLLLNSIVYIFSTVLHEPCASCRSFQAEAGSIGQASLIFGSQ